MTYQDLEQLKSLVDDLCLLHAGWRGEAEEKAFLAAQTRICAHGRKVKQLNEIVYLKNRIAELENK